MLCRLRLGLWGYEVLRESPGTYTVSLCSHCVTVGIQSVLSPCMADSSFLCEQEFSCLLLLMVSRPELYEMMDTRPSSLPRNPSLGTRVQQEPTGFVSGTPACPLIVRCSQPHNTTFPAWTRPHGPPVYLQSSTSPPLVEEALAIARHDLSLGALVTPVGKRERDTIALGESLCFKAG